MRISDCSSDVCSSDLPPRARTTSAYTSGGHDDRPGADAFSPLGHRLDDGTTGVPSRPALPPHEIPGIRHPRTAPTTGTPPPHASGSAKQRQRPPMHQRHVRPRCIRLPSHGSTVRCANPWHERSEEHTSELQSLMRISYAVFCLKKNTTKITQ